MDWLKELNWIDGLIILLLLRGIILGFVHGFVHEFVSLFKIVLNLSVPFFSYPFLAKWLSTRLSISLSILNPSSFILIYIILYFLLNSLIKVRREKEISFLKRVTGSGIGLLKAVIITFFVLLFLNFLPLVSLEKAIEQDSLLAPYFLNAKYQIDY